ncbi:MAG: LPS assembly lipoprotein LptE, partial [Rhodospirillales bacterium]
TLCVVACIGLTLAGCGFRPLYAPPDEDTAGRGVYAFDIFKRVSIDTIPNREGQYFRNQLVQLLQPSGRGSQTDYVLKVVLNESSEALAVQKSALATRANLRVTGRFTLQNLNNKGLDTNGTVTTLSGYNIYQSEFQTLMAEKGARERALDDLAQQLRIRLAAVLTSREGAKPKP